MWAALEVPLTHASPIDLGTQETVHFPPPPPYPHRALCYAFMEKPTHFKSFYRYNKSPSAGPQNASTLMGGDVSFL